MFPCVLEVLISLCSRQHLSLSSECSRPVGVTGCDLQFPVAWWCQASFHGFLAICTLPFLLTVAVAWPGGVSHRAHFIVGIYVAPWLWGKDRAGAMKVGL